MEHGKANGSLKIDKLFCENLTKSHLLPGAPLPPMQSVSPLSGMEGGPGPLPSSPSTLCTCKVVYLRGGFPPGVKLETSGKGVCSLSVKGTDGQLPVQRLFLNRDTLGPPFTHHPQALRRRVARHQRGQAAVCVCD